MSDVERYADDLKMLVNEARKFQGQVNGAFGGSMPWGIEQLTDCFRSMFDRFSPFSVGDRVQLKETPKIQEGSGWYHCRHFLIKGAVGTIACRGYSDGAFTFDVTFDDESWIDRLGEKHLTNANERHTFHFSETWLEKARC